MRSVIIEEALRQITQVGVKKFTMDDIASRLSISKKTIYKYFSGKGDLVSAVVDYVLENEEAYADQVMSSEKSPLAKMEALMFFNNGERVPNWVVEEIKIHYPEEYQKSEDVNRVRRQFFQQLLDEGIRKGELRADVEPAILDLIMRQTVNSLLDTDFLSNQEITLYQAIEQVRNVILYGIAKR